MSYRYPASYRAAVRRGRRRARSRHGGSPAGWQKVALGALAVMALAGAGKAVVHHHHHGGGGAPVAAMAVSGDLSTRLGWAQALLQAIPEPRTVCNVNAVVAWETAEGGGFGNQAENNPLNVNPGAGAGWPGYNAIGAWAFPDAPTGLAYTVQTIRNYGGILSALSAGNNAQAVCDQIMASPWAASHYNGGLSCSC